MPDPKPNDLQAYRPLGIEAAAEMERYFALRSTDIATHLGLSPAAVYRWHDGNPVYWQYLERKWMSEAFGPLAPLHLAARQERDDRRALREMRRSARREAWAKNETQGAQWRATAASEEAAIFRPVKAPLWQRLTVALMDGLRRVTGAALVLIALYFGAAWLAHHALLLP